MVGVLQDGRMVPSFLVSGPMVKPMVKESTSSNLALQSKPPSVKTKPPAMVFLQTGKDKNKIWFLTLTYKKVGE